MVARAAEWAPTRHTDRRDDDAVARPGTGRPPRRSRPQL